MMKTLIILMFLAILVGFTYQIFVVYTTANNVSTAVQRSIMTVASVNMPDLFDSFKEGGAEASDLTKLVTAKELSDDLCEELGLESTATELTKPSSTGGWFYRILNLEVKAENLAAGSGTVHYTADFTLEIPVAEYWSFGSFKIPMHVQAKYTNKY